MIGFELDKNYGKLLLVFDQLVVADSFNISKFTLQSAARTAGPSEAFFFEDSVFNNLTAQGNTTDLLVYISRDDFARLVLQPGIGTNVSTTFAAFGEEAVQSPFGRYNFGQNTTHAFAASSFVSDSSPVYVTDFAIDMENKEMTLNFSEPVNPDTLDVSGLAVQNRNNVFTGGTYVPLVGGGAEVTMVQDYQRRVTFSLGADNYNLINEGEELCTQLENCFASASFAFIEDVAGNLVSTEGFNENFGLPCTNYSRDTTPPTLLWWELNLGLGEVHIVFSEPVHMPFFNYSAVVICNNETLSKSTIVMRVKWPLKYYFENTHFVNFTLLPDQVNYLKELEHVATGMNDTFLILEPNVVTDTARLANSYLGLDATPDAARQARKVHQDIRDPEVIYIVLNMQTWYLRLNFSEIIDVSTVDLREIALLSARGIYPSTELLYLSDPTSQNKISPSIATVREAQDSTCLHIDFTNATITRLKNMALLGHSAENTYVALTYKFVKDLNENTVRTIYYSFAQQVDVFYPDMSSPRLLSWDVDLVRDTLVLRFSEPLNTTSINFAEIIFSSDDVLSQATAVMSPTRGSYISDVNVLNEVFEVWVQLSYDDANEMKKHNSPRLCSSFSDCYVSLSAGFAVDTLSISSDGENIENNIEPFGPARSTSYAADTVSPTLLSYSVDMGAGTLSMVFSEPVAVDSVNTTGISLFSTADPNFAFDNSIRLSRFSFVSDSKDTETLTIIMSRDDRLNVKMMSDIATGSDTKTLWITLENSTCQDVSGNFVNGRAVSTYSANASTDGLTFYRPTLLTEDTSKPTVIAILWSTYDIYVYWDNVVSVASIQEAKFFISSFESIQIKSLDGATVVTTADNHRLQFNYQQIAQSFTSINKIGVSQNNSNLYLPSKAAVRSINGIASAMIGRYSAIRSGNAVVAFHLNMATGLLTFELAYAADFSSFLPAKLKLTRPAKSISISLTGARSWKISFGKFVEVYISDTDLASIKSAGTLSAEADGLFLVVPAATLTETVKNRKLSRQFTVPCSNLIPDTARPQVSYFNLNFGTGIIDIYFSEPVLLSSVSLDGLYIVSSRSDDAEHIVQLSQGAVVTQASNTAGTVSMVSVNLENGPHPTDRDRIHLTGGIGLAASTVNLYIAEGVIADTSSPPNYLHMDGFGDAVAVSSFTADKVRPQLTSYVLNMHSRQLILTYSEAVSPSTNKPSFYTIIQNPYDTDGKSYKLTDSTTSELSFSAPTNIISIDLSDADVDAMMFLYPNLATNAENSFLIMSPLAIRDISPSANGNPEIFYMFASSPKTFYLDRTPPVLVQYNFSLDDGLLTLSFNEVMRCSLTNPSGVQLQHAAFSGSSTQVYRLQNEWSSVLPCIGDFSKIIKLKLGKIEILSIKSKNLLMKSAIHSYLRYDLDTFFDVNENSAHAISDGRALGVSNFLGDTTAPRMLGFSATRQGLLYLYFSEPVYRPSFNLTRIALQDDEDEHPFPFYDLRKYRMMRLRDEEYFSYLARVDSFQMEYVIDMQRDYLDQVHHSAIFNTQETTFLQYHSTLVVDMSGNSIVPMPRDNPINVGPAIVLWNLDLNLNVLTLAFTENVSSVFSPVGFKVQDDDMNPNVTVVLSATDSDFRYVAAELEMYYYVEVTLSYFDMINLRLSGLLDNYETPDLYLACRYNVTRAISPASLSDAPYKSTAIHTFDALPIGDFWPDTLGPSCLYYDLNLNTGVLDLFFSEPVDAGSLDVLKMSFLSFESGDIFRLTEVSSAASVNYTVVSVVLLQSDLCYIKRACRDGVLDYMLIEQGAIVDSFGNNILSNDIDSLISIRTFVPDTSPPSVEAFVYSQNDHTMQLTFDEEIDLDTLMPMKIWIFNSSVVPNAAVQLSNYTVIRHDDVSPPTLPTVVVVDLGLLQVDADRLDSTKNTAKDLLTTHIQLHEVRDIFGNQISGTVLYPATEFLNDTIAPEVVSFDFTDGGVSTDVVVYFSEVIDLESFFCDDFSFSSSQDFSVAADVVSMSVSDCTISTITDSRSVNFQIPSNKFTGTTIGSATSTTWIYVSSSIPKTGDVSGNTISPSSLAVRAGPHISAFFVNIEDGIITLIFTKDVDVSGTVATEGFGFYTIGAGMSTSLSSGAASPTISGYRGSVAVLTTVVELTLSVTDINKLKSIVPFSGDIYITVDTDTIFDAASVSIAPVVAVDSLLAVDLIPDTVRPQLVLATLNKSIDSILLQFDEPILLSSVVVTKLAVQSSAVSDGDTFTLSGGSVSWYDDVGTALMFTLSFDDAVTLKLHSSIGATVDSTFVSFGFGFVSDTAGNDVVPILPGDARQFDDIVVDTVSPELLRFDLNMNEGILQLYFSEPINASSIDTSKILFQNKYYVVGNHLINGTVYRLTGGETSDTNGAVITILLSELDLTGIKNSWNLARLRSSSYLLIEPEAASDMAGNSVMRISNGFAMLCTEFVKDLVRPNVTSISLDYNTGIMKFLFSEPIYLDFVDPAEVTLFRTSSYSVTDDSDYYSLTSTTVVVKPSYYPLSEVVRLKLSRADLSNIRSRYPLGFLPSTTLVSASELFCTDTSGNSMWPIEHWQLNTLVSDTTLPVLESYVLDMSTTLPMITLTFSEAINPSTFNAKDCVIQSYPERRFGYFVDMANTDWELGAGSLSSTVFIHVDFETANEMKLHQIGQFADSGYQAAKSGLLSWGKDFFTDYGGNYISPVYDRSIPGTTNNPVVPTEFHRDDLVPELYTWFFEPTYGIIYLRFSEPVEVLKLSSLKVFFIGSNGSPLGLYSIPESAKTNYSISFGSTVQISNLGDNLLTAFSNRNSGARTELFINTSSIRDMSAIPNYLPLLELKAEGEPLCDTACPAGHYESKQCTVSEDRVCSLCSACPAGEYQFAECSAYADTQCTGMLKS